MKFSLVPPGLLHTCWDEVAPVLADVLPFTYGRHKLEDIRNGIAEERSQLWITFDDGPINGVVVSAIKQYPRRKLLCLQFCAGKNFSEWEDGMLDILDRFAREEKCDGLEMAGRAGWARVLAKHGWSEVFRVYEKDLNDG